jgi:membrane protein DedA with SNARE-associated domain
VIDLLLAIVTAPFDGFNWVADELFLFVNDLFNDYGTPIIFFSGLAEATLGVGVIFPGVIIMFLGGAHASGGGASLPVVFLAATAGTALGDVISYSFGRWGSRWLLSTRLGPSLRLGAQIIDGRARWFIPLYHLHSVTRAVGPFGAGVLRLPIRVWLPLDWLGAAIFNMTYVGAGAIFGTVVLTDDGRLNPHPMLRLGIFIAAMAWSLLVLTAVQRRMRTLRETPEVHLDPRPDAAD